MVLPVDFTVVFCARGAQDSNRIKAVRIEHMKKPSLLILVTGKAITI